MFSTECTCGRGSLGHNAPAGGDQGLRRQAPRGQDQSEVKSLLARKCLIQFNLFKFLRVKGMGAWYVRGDTQGKLVSKVKHMERGEINNGKGEFSNYIHTANPAWCGSNIEENAKMSLDRKRTTERGGKWGENERRTRRKKTLKRQKEKVERKSWKDGENTFSALPSLRHQSKVNFNWIPCHEYQPNFSNRAFLKRNRS